MDEHNTSGAAAASADWQRSIEQRLADGDRRMSDMQTELSANTAVTTEVRDMLQTVRGGLRVLGWFGAAVKWVGGIATGLAALWAVLQAALHNGQLPHR